MFWTRETYMIAIKVQIVEKDRPENDCEEWGKVVRWSPNDGLDNKTMNNHHANKFLFNCILVCKDILVGKIHVYWVSKLFLTIMKRIKPMINIQQGDRAHWNSNINFDKFC